MKNKNDFEYTYTAPTPEERKEIENIRNHYMNPTYSPTKLDELRKLDNKVKTLPVIISLVLGICGTLIFGLGLTMILEWILYVWGTVVCIVGLVPMILAYPLFQQQSKKLKNNYSDQIIKLSEELLKDEKK